MADAIDPNRARNPVSGAAFLFFSGGSALRSLSRQLVKVSHRSMHVITPFDNGGSSAELRRHFRMLSVGDLRNRLLALADFDRPGVRDAHSLLNTRLEQNATRGELLETLHEIAGGSHPRTLQLAKERKRPMLKGLSTLIAALPPGFDPRGASIGNLVLTGMYLDHALDMTPALADFAELLNVRGSVHPASESDLDLAAELADGSQITGQRAITARETTPLSSPLSRLWFCDPLSGAEAPLPRASARALAMIASADMIIYPYGSFWTSLVAALKPAGILDAIRQSRRPKVWIPSTWPDPEISGMRLEETLDRLLGVLGVMPGSDAAGEVLDAVIVDPRNGRYTGGLSSRALRARKVRVLEHELVSPESSPGIDPARLIPILQQLS